MQDVEGEKYFFPVIINDGLIDSVGYRCRFSLSFYASWQTAWANSIPSRDTSVLQRSRAQLETRLASFKGRGDGGWILGSWGGGSRLAARNGRRVKHQSPHAMMQRAIAVESITRDDSRCLLGAGRADGRRFLHSLRFALHHKRQKGGPNQQWLSWLCIYSLTS